ncbi:MAG: response regulator [Deltaproteobacteria bacterium]|jgi:DNA-binding NtrC family response regulator
MSGEPIKILLVDDEEDFVEMLSLRLEAAGQEVTSAHSGRKCLRVLEDKDIDVVILDVKMPGMDGIETLQEIKRRFPSVEVILMTGHGAIESAIEGQALGAFDFLLKPADFNELMEKLQAARKKKAEQNA